MSSIIGGIAMSDRILINELEAIKMGINIEKLGERFYRGAAEKFAAISDIASVFLDLAEEEKDHAETFQQIYDDFADKKQEFDDTYLYEPEIEAYLRAAVETTIFPSEEKYNDALSQIQSPEDALRLGIQMEKDSILFYTEMIIHSQLLEAKDAYRKLLKEEKKHLVDLKHKLDNMLKK